MKYFEYNDEKRLSLKNSICFCSHVERISMWRESLLPISTCGESSVTESSVTNLHMWRELSFLQWTIYKLVSEALSFISNSPRWVNQNEAGKPVWVYGIGIFISGDHMLAHDGGYKIHCKRYWLVTNLLYPALADHGGCNRRWDEHTCICIPHIWAVPPPLSV